MPRLSPEYVAGLFDGEGCFYIKFRQKPRPEYLARAVLQIREESIVRSLFEQYHGNIRKQTRHIPWSDVWTWELSGSLKLNQFIEEISPFLIVKKEQAQLVKRLTDLKLANGSGRPITDDEWEERAAIKESMHVLNKRGKKDE